MKYSFIVILFLSPLLIKCTQKVSDQDAKKPGVTSGEKITTDSIEEIQYDLTQINSENKFVTYIDSTNTFIIDNEK